MASRVRHPRLPGVYVRNGRRGKRYEISFLDSTGKRRWKVVEGGEREALAALEDVRSRIRRGERVVPSRTTFEEFGREWLREQTGIRPGTRRLYEFNLERFVFPRVGSLRLSQITVDHVAALVADLREAGYAPATIRNALIPLSRAFGTAVRRGLVPANPVKGLERGERPTGGRSEMRILDRREIPRLIAATPEPYRVLVATAVFSGLRQGEIFGLKWSDVDFDAGVIRVRRQRDRSGELVPPKTPAAVRAVVIFPALGRLLREHRLASGGRDDGFVFASRSGESAVHWRNASRRGLDVGLEAIGLLPARPRGKPGRPRAGEVRPPRPKRPPRRGPGDSPAVRWHDLRHTFASLLIASGADVVWVSKQLGHASVSITLDVYSHLFDAAKHAERTREALEAEFGATLADLGGAESGNVLGNLSCEFG